MVVRPSEGGAFEHVGSLARELAGRGHEVAVCGPHGHLGDLGVELIELDIVRPLSPPGDARAAVRLGRIIRSYSPDIVHAHGSKGGVMARAARVATPRTPVVLTPHGFAFAGFFQSARSKRVYKGIERAFAPLASRVVCVCEAEARLARSVGAGKRVRVVHNGIDPPPRVEPDPAVAALRRGGPLVGVLSGLRPGKGLEVAIGALAQSRRSRDGVQLVVAGEGPERPALEALAARAGVADAVHLIGLHRDPYSFLAALDLFAFPSLAESFPYAILEAMASARPIVASDVGGVGEALVDGESGVLVEPGDVDGLASAIVETLADAPRAEALGSAAAARRAECFTLARMAEGTLGVYDELL